MKHIIYILFISLVLLGCEADESELPIGSETDTGTDINPSQVDTLTLGSIGNK